MVIYKPFPYQDHGSAHIISHKGCGLFFEMGLGKTVSTLTAIDELMHDRLEISKVLVIAPKRVAEDVWTGEASKWDHLKHLRISVVLGSERERKQALIKKADIYVINRENVTWLVNHYATAFPFDMVVIDELSSFKSAKSSRFKSLRRIRPKIKRVVGLTGTPAPNGLMDLWSQLYLLDQGERLGETLTGYREKYFTEGKKNGYVVFDYNIRKEDSKDPLIGADYYEKKIYNKISDICISMKETDWLTLPELIETDIAIKLPSAIQLQYDQFEKEQVLALVGDEKITAINAAALTNKLLQFAGGAVYTEDKVSYREVHTKKLEALAEDIEAANGNPFLIFYSYRHELERMKIFLKEFKPVELKTSADIAAWNSKKITVLLAHPASAGHGLNMQFGGDFVGWYGLPWSLELYQQAIKRVHRQGREEKVFLRRYITKGTMDEDVIKALNRKAGGQEALMQAVKARVEKYIKQ